MKSGKSVRREKIHVGKLSVVSELDFDDEAKMLYIGNVQDCRSILFIVDEQGLAQDLLYDSPRYPVLDVSDDEQCVIKKGCEKPIVLDSWNLERLLKSLGYASMLTGEDILRIRNTIFDSKGSERLKMFSDNIAQLYKECIRETRNLSLLESIKKRMPQDSFKPNRVRSLKRTK